MNITFGCVIIHSSKILLVKEKSHKTKKLEKWNIPSGSARKDEFIFKRTIKQKMKKAMNLNIVVEGLVGLYESITPIDTTYYFVVGCKTTSDIMNINDPDIVEAKFFLLDEFFNLPEPEIVHKDMWHVAKKYLDGILIDALRTVQYK